MPLTFSVKPDSIYRIWFGFAEYSGDEIMPPEITPIVRKGFTVIEWANAVNKIEPLHFICATARFGVCMLICLLCRNWTIMR